MFGRTSPAAAVAAALLFAVPAAARDIFECNFPEVGNNMGYLPLVVVIAREPGSDTALVVDPIIQSEKGGPIEVKISAENDAKLSLSWSIMLKSLTNDYIKMAYRVSIQKSSLSASLSGRPQGFSNNFTAQGTCKRTKG